MVVTLELRVLFKGLTRELHIGRKYPPFPAVLLLRLRGACLESDYRFFALLPDRTIPV